MLKMKCRKFSQTRLFTIIWPPNFGSGLQGFASRDVPDILSDYWPDYSGSWII
jgi:hypothetical protein